MMCVTIAAAMVVSRANARTKAKGEEDQEKEVKEKDSEAKDSEPNALGRKQLEVKDLEPTGKEKEGGEEFGRQGTCFNCGRIRRTAAECWGPSQIAGIEEGGEEDEE